MQRGLFNRDAVTSQRQVYPLGDPQSLPVAARPPGLPAERRLGPRARVTHAFIFAGFDPVNEMTGGVHHVHVTDITLSSDTAEPGGRAPLHHRCFALGGLDASRLLVGASSCGIASRGCGPWLRRESGSELARLDARAQATTSV